MKKVVKRCKYIIFDGVDGALHGVIVSKAFSPLSHERFQNATQKLDMTKYKFPSDTLCKYQMKWLIISKYSFQTDLLHLDLVCTNDILTM